MHYHRKLLSGVMCLLFLSALLPLAAETLTTQQPLHVLHELEIETDKYTRESALLKEMGIPEGMSLQIETS